MTQSDKGFLQMTCLINEAQERLTKRILATPNDVSHEWYRKVFEGFDWEAYEQAKEAKTQE